MFHETSLVIERKHDGFHSYIDSIFIREVEIIYPVFAKHISQGFNIGITAIGKSVVDTPVYGETAM